MDADSSSDVEMQESISMTGVKDVVLKIAVLAGAAGATFEAAGTDSLKPDGMGDTFNGIAALQGDCFILWNRFSFQVREETGILILVPSPLLILILTLHTSRSRTHPAGVG
jgi:hypothetical protein